MHIGVASCDMVPVSSQRSIARHVPHQPCQLYKKTYFSLLPSLNWLRRTCWWNYTLKSYSRKDLTSVAWKKIMANPLFRTYLNVNSFASIGHSIFVLYWSIVVHITHFNCRWTLSRESPPSVGAPRFTGSLSIRFHPPTASAHYRSQGC